MHLFYLNIHLYMFFSPLSAVNNHSHQFNFVAATRLQHVACAGVATASAEASTLVASTRAAAAVPWPDCCAKPAKWHNTVR